MTITFKPIGYVRNPHQEVLRHWSVSDLEGALDMFDGTPILDIKPHSEDNASC